MYAFFFYPITTLIKITIILCTIAKFKRQLSFLLSIVVIPLYLFGMYRSAGIDIKNYRNAYERVFENVPNIIVDPGFNFLMALGKFGRLEFEVFLLVLGIVNLCLIFLISKKFNASYGIVLSILILHLIIVRDFAQMRVGLAVNITLYAYFLNNRIKYVLYVFGGALHISCLVLSCILISYKIFINSKRFYIICIPFIAIVIFGSFLTTLAQLDPRIELYMNYDRAGYGQPVNNFNQLFFVVYFLLFSMISTDTNKNLFIYSFASAFFIFLSFSSVSIFSHRLTNVALSLYPYFISSFLNTEKREITKLALILSFIGIISMRSQSNVIIDAIKMGFE